MNTSAQSGGSMSLGMTNSQILSRLAQLVEDKEFLFDSTTEKWYSYRQLWNRAYAIANALVRCRHRTVIAVMNNGFNLFVLYFACMLSDITIVPIDPLKSRKEIERIIADYKDYLLLADGDKIFYEDNDVVSKKIITDRIGSIDLDKDFIITYTSGSTGRSKGVIHNLRNLFFAAAVFGEVTRLNDKYSMAHVMPMTYMAGILNTIILPFFCEAKIVLLPRFDIMSAINFWKAVERLNITAFWFSPTMLNMIMSLDKKAKVKEYLLKKDTLFFVGTAPLSENTRQRFESKYGVQLLQSYGLTETLFISTETIEMDKDVKSVGTVLPHVKIDFDNNNEICIDVPWMFSGYYNADNKDYFMELKYKTGDIGMVDDKNRLSITGRIKDLIVKGGINISSAQIEKYLYEFEEITECAVAGVTINGEENIVCWYLLKSEMTLSHNEVNKFLEKELGRYYRIDYFCPLKNIPKNLNGKVDKMKLKREFFL